MVKGDGTIAYKLIGPVTENNVGTLMAEVAKAASRPEDRDPAEAGFTLLEEAPEMDQSAMTRTGSPITPNPRRVRVIFEGTVIAETARALILAERLRCRRCFMFRAQDATMAAFTPTDRRTHCPFKGDASYFTLSAGGRTAENAVWSYEAPFAAVAAITDHLAFYPDKVTIEDCSASFATGTCAQPDHDAGFVRSPREVRISIPPFLRTRGPYGCHSGRTEGCHSGDRWRRGIELTEPMKALQIREADPKLVSLQTGSIQAMEQGRQCGLQDPRRPRLSVDPSLFHALVLPGGTTNPDKLRVNPAGGRVREAFRRHRQADRRDLPWPLDAGRGRRGRWHDD